MVGEPSHYVFKSSPYSSHSRILGLLPPQGKGRRVLDVGCGPGYLMTLLASRGFQVTGVDRAAPQELAPGANFVAADLLTGLPPLHEHFDYILFADVLEHLPDPERLVGWAIDHLKPGGQILISVPNVAHAYVRWKLLWGHFDYTSRGILDRTHLRFYTRRSLAAFLKACGLVCREIYSTPAPLELVAPLAWQGRLFGLVCACHAALARWVPTLLAYQFVCVAVPSSLPAPAAPVRPLETRG